MDAGPLPTRLLGRTGQRVSALGLGGEGVLRTFARDQQARAVIEAALEEGITYFDCARAYAGSEQYYGATLGSRRDAIFLCSKAHDRSFAGALEMLDLTLRNMHTDHLDLWQLHDVRTEEDLDLMEGERGTYAAFARAKQQGKARFIGITGHYDPEIMLEAIRRFDFDTVLLPVNPCEAAVDSFASVVIPEARARGMGVIAMKVLGRGLLLGLQEDPTLQSLTDYALSAQVSVAIIGCDDVDQVRAAAHAVRSFAPLAPSERSALERRMRSESKRVLYYRRPSAPA
ncbi:MAG: aldo/keto reductase [Candidatus Eremiobacteraeota bacterium]|nr:aldo/keto reductase [Candidatus Eremiobacteraeota bacterium]